MKPLIFLLADLVRDAVRSAFDIDADPMVTVAQHERWGDYQSNVAMGLAKQRAAAGTKPDPRATAQAIIDHIRTGDIIGELSIAGPGFINIRLKPEWMSAQLNAIRGGQAIGIEKTPSAQRVVVDYSGPNIAKQMHVGHLRSTIIGDAISRVLEFLGHEVIRQNHIGDWGTQFGMLVAHLRSLESGGSRVHIADLEEFYREAKKRFDEEPAFQDEARQTVVRLQGGGADELEKWREIVDETRLHYQPVYDRLGVKLRPEHERGESFYNPYLPKVVEQLRAKGVAEESDGAICIFVEGYEAPIIIEKKGGGYLYSTTDLAGIFFRVHELKANRIIYTHDSRQSQHFAQVFAAARRAGWADGVSLEYAPFGTMLGEDGKPFKTREGGTVKLRELLDEAEERAFAVVSQKNPWLGEEQQRAVARAVGIGGVKYADLSKDRVSDYVFSWDKMLALDGNTAPYLQYACARVSAIFRKADLDPESATAEVILANPFEIALGRHILRMGEVIETVSRELKPHHLCTYLYELATRFSSFYENCPVLQSPEPERGSRLALCALTLRALSLGLDLLGIEHPGQM